MADSIQLTPENAQAAKDAAAGDQHAEPRNVQVRATGKTYSVVYNQGKVTTSTSAATAKGTNAPIAQVNAPATRSDDSGVVTGKSPAGRALSGDELQHNSVIQIGNMKTSLAGAAAAGFIAKNSSGQWTYTDKARAMGHVAATPAQPQQPKQTQQQPTQEPAATEEASKPVPLDNDGEALLQEFNAAVPSDVLRSGITGVIKAGQLSNEDIATVAKHFGISQEEAQQKAVAFQESFSRQAYQAVGPAAETIFNWARGADPAALEQAAHDHVHFGNLGGYKGLADRYMQNLDTISPETILNSEDGKRMNARLEANGRISLNTPRGRMGWSSWMRVAPKKPHLT